MKEALDRFFTMSNAEFNRWLIKWTLSFWVITCIVELLMALKQTK